MTGSASELVLNRTRIERWGVRAEILRVESKALVFVEVLAAS
jgi:hypothetical protein